MFDYLLFNFIELLNGVFGNDSYLNNTCVIDLEFIDC